MNLDTQNWQFPTLNTITIKLRETVNRRPADKQEIKTSSNRSNSFPFSQLSQILLCINMLTMIFDYPVFRGLKYLWQSKIKYHLKSCCCRNQVSDDSKSAKMPCFLEREYKKTDPGDYTLSEYTEKVILYGFLMVSHLGILQLQCWLC